VNRNSALETAASLVEAKQIQCYHNTARQHTERIVFKGAWEGGVCHPSGGVEGFQKPLSNAGVRKISKGLALGNRFFKFLSSQLYRELHRIRTTAM
jgi:hypothetical protein